MPHTVHLSAVTGDLSGPRVFMGHFRVPSMVLSVRLSEFLVKAMDKGLPTGHLSQTRLALCTCHKLVGASLVN